MKKIISIFILSLLIILSSTVVSTNAITPNIVCDEIGCILSSTRVAKTLSTPYKYYQTDYTDTMYGCSATIAQGGCALTSFSMVLANLMNNSTSYTPPLVNTGLYNNGIDPINNSCSYSPYNWGQKSVYKNIISYVSTGYQGSYYTAESMYNLVKTHIDNNQYIIFNGGPKVSSGTGNHYSLIIGYEKIDIVYVTGYEIHETNIYIVDTASRLRTEIMDYINVYTKVYQFFAYKKD